MSEATLWEIMKFGIKKTTLANIAAFLLVLGGMGYGICANNKDIVLLAMGWGGGYLFGVAKANS